MRQMWFWFRWSVRDLRRRWVQVIVIALVIAIGTGAYAGLSSMLNWRRVSYDASYEALAAHDLRVRLSSDSFVPEGRLAAALGSISDPAWIEDSEERLIARTQVEAATPAEAVLVPGRIVGVRTGDGGPGVDRIDVTAGRGFPDGEGVVLEKHFADRYDLPEEGRLLLAGGIPVRYTGVGLSPEYFMVTSGQGDLMAQANFAVVFMPLPLAQEITGRAGRVNDLVLRLAPGVDREAAKTELEIAMAETLPGVGAVIESIEDDPAYMMLYEDLDSDRGITLGIAFLVLAAAAFAAFTLTSRIVEAERREIGINMALGVRRASIAARPLLGAAWIAALGVVLGLGMGLLMAALLRSFLSGLIPLPVLMTPLEAGPFFAAAAIGFLLPFAASVWPVLRAVRVEPVKAIRTGHLAARGGGLAPLVKRLRLPGDSLFQIPFRNVVRAPRRAVLTALGLGAAIVTLVVIAGSLDSFNHIRSGVSSEVGRGAADRLAVTLTGFQPADSGVVRSIGKMRSVGRVEPAAVLPATVENDDVELTLQLEAIDLESDVWHPTVSPAAEGERPSGVILSNKAAEDLGVRPGDTLSVRHPYRTGEDTFVTREERVRVAGTHPSPMRFLAYVDISEAGVFGVAGLTNELQVVPADGFTVAEVKRDLFEVPEVAAVQEPGATVDATGDLLESFSGVFRVVQGFALFLALLIAFNAASIGADERARENATMMAYGVRVRTLLRMLVQEGVVIGVLGSLVGIGLGIVALSLFMANSASTLPELELQVVIQPTTIVLALFFSVLVVGLAPLLTARKLRRTDIPSTLRVME